MSSPADAHVSLSKILEFFGAGRGTAPFDPEAAPKSDDEQFRQKLVPIAALGDPPKSAYEKHQASICRKKLHNETVTAGLIVATTYCFGYRVLLRRKPINLHAVAIAGTLFWFTKMGTKRIATNICANERMLDMDPRATTAAFLRSAYKEHVIAKGLKRAEPGEKIVTAFGKLSVTDEQALSFVEEFEAEHGAIPRLADVPWPAPTKWQRRIHENWLREKGALAPEYEAHLDRLGYPLEGEAGSEQAQRQNQLAEGEEAWWQEFKPKAGEESPAWMKRRPWQALVRI